MTGQLKHAKICHLRKGLRRKDGTAKTYMSVSRCRRSQTGTQNSPLTTMRGQTR